MHRPPSFMQRRPPMRAPRFAPRSYAPRTYRAQTTYRAPRQIYRAPHYINQNTRGAAALTSGVSGVSRGGYFHPPVRYGGGRLIQARPVRNMTAHTALVSRAIESAATLRGIRAAVNAASERDGRFHWHAVNGVRYAHWYDPKHQRDWFGFYRGNSFFWSIYWKNYFWWEEPSTGRWLVFWRNHWWWHSPAGVAYVFVGDQYYVWNQTPDGGIILVQAPAPIVEDYGSDETDQEPGQALTPEPQEEEQAAPSEEPQSPPPQEQAPQEEGAPGTMSLTPSFPPEYHYSADGTRMVQVEGEDRAAYLYDTTRKDANGENVLIRYLDQGVTDVRFTDTSKGSPLQIILATRTPDGSIRHTVYDGDGNPMGNASEAQLTPPPAENPVEPAVDQPPSQPPMPDGA